MRIIVQFSIDGYDIPKSLLEQLWETYPEGRYPNAFSLKLPIGDPRTQTSLQILAENGWHPVTYFNDVPSKVFGAAVIRTYSAKDFAHARYLVVLPKINVDAGRDEAGTLLLVSNPQEGGIKPNEPIASAAGLAIVVSDDFKKSIENSALIGTSFKETVFDEPYKAHTSPFWELTSSIVLPPVSPKVLLVDEQSKPYDGNPDTIYYLREGTNFPEALYRPAELHYTQQAIESMPPFDIAQTVEHFGWYLRPQLVASQRFYQFCVEHQLKMKWQPVRIDDIEE